MKIVNEFWAIMAAGVIGTSGCSYEEPAIPPPPAPIQHEVAYQEMDAGVQEIITPTAEKILSTARVYEGLPYGDGEGQYTCTGLVEQVLRDLGILMNARRREIIHVATGTLTPWEEMDRIDSSRGGVAYMLFEAKLADEVPVSDAEPGDFVQYWWREGKSRHTAIIERRAERETCFDLYGSHTKKTGVGTWHDVYLGPPRKVFVVRMRADVVGVE